MTAHENQSRSARSARSAWLLLAVAAVALAFANGRWYVPIAAWLAPLFLVLFLDGQPARRGLAAAFGVQLLAFFVNWQGMIPVPGVWYYVIAATYAVVYFVPFVVHRLLAPRLRGFVATLVLPTAWVGTEFLVQQFVTPYGSWVSLAYTQVEQLWLFQLASVTGLAGISFVMLWTASVVAWVWKHCRTPALTRRGRIAFAVVFLAIFMFGAYRLMRTPRADGATRVAGITPSEELASALESEFVRIREATSVDSVSLAGIEKIAKAINDDLVHRTHLEAQAGADVVVWSEHAARVTPPMETELLAEAAELAREYEVVLILGVGVWDPGATPPFENKAVVIRSDGTVASHYGKARPIAGAESSLIDEGGTGIAMLTTEHGRIGTVICHDLDFPDFIRAAGREEVAILIGPSADWDEITPFHAQMASARAVENGCFLFRPCTGGLSLAVDPFGRPVASVLDEGTDGNVLVASLPSYRVSTVYARAGNLFGYASLAGILVLATLGMTGRRRR
jgi:apolipoprotein N-acyltransferase